MCRFTVLQTIIAILFIILSVLFLTISTLVILKSIRKKEEFVNTVNNDYYDNDQTVPDADASQIKKYGIQKCKALNGKLLDESTDNYIMVQEFINTNRLKEGKNNNECFLYDDSAKNMQDPLMVGSICDINNPLFKGNPMFKNIYSDKTQDDLHKYPIQKCVMEFEESEINETNITNFLSVIKDEQCSKIAKLFTDDLASILEKYAELSRQNANLNKEYGILKNNFDIVDRDNKACILKRGKLNEDIIFNNTENNLIIKNDAIVYDEFKTCESNLNNLWFTTSNDISIFNKDIENLNLEYATVGSNLSKCEKSNDEIRKAINRMLNGIEKQSVEATYMFGSNAYLYRSNELCERELRVITKNADLSMVEYKKCFPHIEEYEICKPALMNCNKELSLCEQNFVEYSSSYENFRKQYQICAFTLSNTEIELKDCLEKEKQLKKLNEEYIQTIAEQVLLIPDLEEQKRTCLIDYSDRTIFDTELKKRNDELRASKYSTLESCAGVQKEKEQNKLKLLKKKMEAVRLSNNKHEPKFDGANTTNRPVIDIERDFLTEPFLWETFNSRVKWIEPFLQGLARDNTILGVKNPWLDVLSSFPDNNAYWMWGTKDFTNAGNESNREIQNDPIIHQFQAEYKNDTREYIEATIYLIIDDYGWLYLNYNDTAIHNKNYSHNVKPIKIYQEEKLFKIKVRLNPGRNTITIDAVNKNNVGGGVLFTMVDMRGRILIRSSVENFKCHVTNNGVDTSTTATKAADAPIPLTHLVSRKCIDGSTSTLKLSTCDISNKNQNWIKEPGMDATNFTLRNESSGKCIDGNGTSLYLRNCDPKNAYQNFSKEGNLIKHNATGKCIDGNANVLDSLYFGICRKQNGYQNWI